MVEEIWFQDTRPILVKYDKVSASLRKMAEEIWIPDTRPTMIKYGKLHASLRKIAEEEQHK